MIGKKRENFLIVPFDCSQFLSGRRKTVTHDVKVLRILPVTCLLRKVAFILSHQATFRGYVRSDLLIGDSET